MNDIDPDKKNIFGLTKKESIRFQKWISYFILIFLMVHLISTLKGNELWCEQVSFCSDCSYNFINGNCNCCGNVFNPSKVVGNNIVNLTKIKIDLNISDIEQ